MELKMSWSEHLVNSREIRSIFQGDDLSLKGLLLLRLQYLPGNQLIVSLVQKELPPIIPDRWSAKKIVGLEMEFSLGISALEINIQQEFSSMPPLSVSIEANSFQLWHETIFILKANYFYVKLKVRPLDSVPAL